jgi:hypothetical protein
MNGKDDRIQNTEFRGQSLHSGIQVQRGTRMRRMQLIRRIAPGVDNSHLQEQQQSVFFRARRVVGSRTIRPIRSIRVIRVPHLNLDAARGANIGSPRAFQNSEFSILNSVIFAVTHPS